MPLTDEGLRATANVTDAEAFELGPAGFALKAMAAEILALRQQNAVLRAMVEECVSHGLSGMEFADFHASRMAWHSFRERLMVENDQLVDCCHACHVEYERRKDAGTR